MWLGWVLLLGWALAACGGGGGATTGEVADAGDETTPDATPEPATAEEAPTASSTRSTDEGAVARYGDAAFTIGDRVQLARRAGLLTSPDGRGQVEAAAGKVGDISAVLDPEGLVEVTWDAQDWTVHGGYSWVGKENLGLSDVQGATSLIAGTVTLEPFATTVHVSYLVLFGT